MTYLYPTPISPYPMRCYCLELPDAPEYHRAFVDLLMTMTRWWAWQPDREKHGKEVAAYLLSVLLPQLEGNFMCCCDQTSAILQFQIMNQFIVWSSATVNTDINIYAPVTTFETTAGETEAEHNGRIDALCYAVEGMVDVMCDAAIKILDQQINGINLLAAIGALVSAVLGLLSFGTGYVLGWAITSALLYAAGSLAGLVTKPQLENTTARHELACAIRDALKDLAPTEANLWSAIDGLSGLGTDATALLSVLQNLHVRAQDSKEIFQAFINALGEGQQLGIAGLLPGCRCGACVTYPADGWTLVTGSDLGGGVIAGSSGDYLIRYTVPEPAAIISVSYQDETTSDDWCAKWSVKFWLGGSLVHEEVFFNQCTDHYDWYSYSTSWVGSAVDTVEICCELYSGTPPADLKARNMVVCWEPL